MKADDVVNMSWGAVPIPFHVQVKWTGDHTPRELAYDTVIESARENKLTVLSPSRTGMCVSINMCNYLSWKWYSIMNLTIV